MSNDFLPTNLTLEERVIMWRENYARLNMQLQEEQQKCIWYERRYNELVRALKVLFAHATDVSRET